MSSGSFGSTSTSVIGNTQNWVHTPTVALPTGRNTMFSGATNAVITTLGAFVSGRGAGRSVQLAFESLGSTGSFSVGSASSAQDTGAQPCAIICNGGSDTFRISSSGQFYFGRGPTGGPSSDSFGYSFSDSLYGYYTYTSAPTAPLTPAVVASGATAAVVSWTAPTDNGDTAITGYRVDYSASPTFASGVSSVEVGNVLTYTVTALSGTTAYYFRVFAENAVTTLISTWSLPSTTVSLTSGAGGAPPAATFALQSTVACAFTYPATSAGFWSFWMTPNTTTSWVVSAAVAGTFGGTNLLFGVDPTSGLWASTTTNANPIGDGPTYLPAAGFAGAHHFAVGVGALFSGTVWTFPLTLYVDGVLVATASSSALTPPATWLNANRQPTAVLVGTLGAVGSVVMSRLKHTLNLSHEEFATQNTESSYLSAMAAATSQVALGVLPANLSAVPVGFPSASGQTTLDAFNLIVKTEQGYIDTLTSGMVSSPAQTVRVRARDRPSTVSYSFDAQLELSEQPNFLRDSTNLIWSDVVTGANSTTQTVSQTALQIRAGSNNAADTVATYRASDLYEYGTDRLWRGQNVALRPVSVVVNNLVCPTDRSADLLSMVPGDRIRITNIPTTVIGFTTWDGWLLDKEQSHKSGPGAEDKFILYLQPCQPLTAIFDTDLFANGGTLTVSTLVALGATTMVCKSGDLVTYFEQVAVPYTLLIDQEQVTVTACGVPAAGVQTLTITRAVNGTAAAAHQVGAVPEVVTNSLFAF